MDPDGGEDAVTSQQILGPSEPRSSLRAPLV